MEKNYQIVNIGHFVSRTGTVFLHSLLDDHPQILSIPGVINFRNLLNKKTFYSIEEAFDIFDKENPKFYDTSQQNPSDIPDNGLYQLGEDKKDKIFTNKEDFKDMFLKNLKLLKDITFQNILISLNIAYGKVHDKDINKCKVILLHPHEKNDCIKFNNLFKGSKFLITVRNPINVYNSIIKMVKRRTELRNEHYYPAGQLVQSAKGLEDFRKNKMEMYILKFENLGVNLENEMKKICDFIKIDYNPSILKSTFGGKKFWGNNYYNPREKYVLNTTDIKETLSKKDIIILSEINKKIIKEFNYTDIVHKNYNHMFFLLSIFLPLKDEIDFIKKFNLKNFILYLKFICFFLPKRIYLLYIRLKRRI